MTDPQALVSSSDPHQLSGRLGRIFASRPYFRLWRAQMASSLGDWMGWFATLAIANKLTGAATGVSLVVVARIFPGFFLATVGGVIVDRLDRRKVMVFCDCGRAVLIAMLPFVNALWQLIAISLLLEVLTLLWGPAKDASVPHFVDESKLASANSLSLVASYGTMPLGAATYGLLLTISKWLGHIDALSRLNTDRQSLALYGDALTFLVSAFIVARLPIPHERTTPAGERRIDLGQTFREIREGLAFIRSNRLVRAVMIGMAGGLIGGGGMVPLGPVFAEKVLGSAAQFAVLMAALGIGAAIGVFTVSAIQRRFPHETVFVYAVAGVGVSLVAAAALGNVVLVAIAGAGVGAASGSGYATGFAIVQGTVSDELRGRTFATLYSIVRLCLLLAIAIAPVFADLFDGITGIWLHDHTLRLGGVHYGIPGVRLALWGGGLVALCGAWRSRHELRKVHEVERVVAEP